MLRKVHIASLTLDPDSNTPVVMLKDDALPRVIPIWIGLLEATSIVSALRNVQFDRPLTHDLFINLLKSMHTDIMQVEICDIRDNTYYARIHLYNPDRSFTMDARPSDAIALALRARAPIFVDEAVMEKVVGPEDPVEVLDESEEGQKWTEYLNSLSAEDFGKYKV